MRSSRAGMVAVALVATVFALSAGATGCADRNAHPRKAVAAMEKDLDLQSIGSIGCRRVHLTTLIGSNPYQVTVALNGDKRDAVLQRLKAVDYTASSGGDASEVWQAPGHRHVILYVREPSDAGARLDYGGKACVVPPEGLTVTEMTNQ